MALTEKYGSKKEVHAAMKGSASSGAFLRVKDGDRIKVRFLTEMGEWERAFYHYLDSFLWCSRRPDCRGCEAEDRPKRIWLANVLNRDTGKVAILQVPFSISEQIQMKDAKYDTIMDRDYEVSRVGAGLTDTKYSLDWDSPRPFKAERYNLIDIAAAILAELGLDDGDEEEDEEEEPRSSKSQRIREHDAKKKSRSRDEDEDEDEDDEEEDERPAPRRSSNPSRDGLDEFRPKKPLRPEAKRVVRRSR